MQLYVDFKCEELGLYAVLGLGGAVVNLVLDVSRKWVEYYFFTV